MEQLNMAKQMMAFQKAAYDNYLNVLDTVYEQGQKIIDMSIDQTTWWLPQEGKKAMTGWLGQLNEARTGFLQAADENVKRFQSMFAAEETPSGGVAAKTKKA